MKLNAALGWFVCLIALAGLVIFLRCYQIKSVFTTITTSMAIRPYDGRYTSTPEEFITINQEIADYLQKEAPGQGYVYQVPREGWIGDDVKSNLPTPLANKVDRYRWRRLMQMKYPKEISEDIGVKITF